MVSLYAEPAERLYRATLVLAVSRVEEAERLLAINVTAIGM
jgi:hypothetical protein